ncbi:MAG: hypothetical protein UT33_C0007G0095 [Candidatus Peregrinibacteria bacterium GW2011_GWC2_39_14]|nr:MAG: hypothetical protein US92_C0002G0097 [Candidatus Peregrinibacteria bacterium GW2011_GWA2_38_36]KKR06907.1 MAG: hypothetical protein UT33_C0007G0095 [Candidatus Peregrinibacteria bacterium GW2011_GWC2_39_14]
MANVNRAQRQDEQDTFNDDDINALSEGKVDAQDIFEQQEAFTRQVIDIRERLERADGVLSAQEQKRYKDKLLDIEISKDRKGLKTLDKEMAATVADTQKLTHSYFEKLDTNRELFGLDKDRHVDTLAEYKQEFKQQDVKGKETYFKQVDQEIDSLRELQDKLVKLVGNSPAHMEEFNKLRRHEKRDEYLPELETVMKQYNSFMKKLEGSKEYDASEIRMMEMRFKESSVADQKKLLQEWGFEGKTEAGAEKVAEVAQELKAQFNLFSPTRQKKFDREFADAKTKRRQTEIIDSMRADLKQDYMKRVNGSKYLSSSEKQKALQSVSDKNFDIKFIELCLSSFAQCEAKVKQFEKTYSNAPKEVQDQYHFWEADYEEKQKIIEEVKEHVKIGKEFEAKVKKFAEEGLVAKKSMSEDKDYIVKWRHNFRKLSLVEKKKLLQNSSLDAPIRKQVLADFRALPEAQRKPFEKAFMKGNLRERLKILTQLKEQGNEMMKNRDGLTKKVGTMEKRGTLAHKSARAYEAWIKTLSAEDLKKYAKKSELDDPRREKMLDLFESMPKSAQEKHNSFYEMDLNERIALMSKLKPEDTKKALDAAENQETAEDNVLDFKKRVEIKALRKVADQFKENGNLQAEMHLHQQILELNPKDKQSLARMQEIQKMENPLLKMLDDKLQGNDELKRQVEGYQIVDIFETLIRRSELAEGAKGLEERSGKFKDSRMAELNKELAEHSKGTQILDETTGRAIDVEDLDVDRVEEGSDKELVNKYVDLFREERPMNTANQNQSRLRRLTMHKRDGRELKGEEIKQKKAEFEDQLAQKLGVGKTAQDRENLKKAVKKTRHSRLNTYDIAA